MKVKKFLCAITLGLTAMAMPHTVEATNACGDVLQPSWILDITPDSVGFRADMAQSLESHSFILESDSIATPEVFGETMTIDIQNFRKGDVSVKYFEIVKPLDTMFNSNLQISFGTMEECNAFVEAMKELGYTDFVSSQGRGEICMNSKCSNSPVMGVIGLKVVFMFY